MSSCKIASHSLVCPESRPEQTFWNVWQIFTQEESLRKRVIIKVDVVIIRACLLGQKLSSAQFWT